MQGMKVQGFAHDIAVIDRQDVNVSPNTLKDSKAYGVLPAGCIRAVTTDNDIANTPGSSGS